MQHDNENGAPSPEGNPASHQATAEPTRPDHHDRNAPVAPGEPWTLPRLRNTNPRDRRAPHVLADRRLKRVIDQAHIEAQERRARVLKHEDLRAALSAAGFRPECWNGYVPPRLDSNGCLNTSPQRHDLVAISAEAWRREHEPQAA